MSARAARRSFSSRRKSSHHRVKKSPLAGLYSRALRIEPLEDRRLLSINSYPELPGMVLVDPRPDQFKDQVVYLDFDGAQDVTYNGPVVVEDIDVPAFEAPSALAGHEQQIIADVVTQLDATFAGTGIIFTTTQPAAGAEYSTIYIGGDDSAFRQYGSFLGLAEQVDTNNYNTSDSALVFSVVLPKAKGIDDYGLAISGLVSHELGHLMGYEHDGVDRGATSVLAPFAYNGDTHAEIVEEAAKLYLSLFGVIDETLEYEDHLYGHEDGDFDAGSSLIEGVVEEDMPIGRTVNHFCDGGDLLAGGGDELLDGLGDGLTECDSAYEKASGETYPEAMNQYFDGDLESAYWWLGRTMHLLQDMTVPAHVHNDEHTWPLTNDDDWYERTVYENLDSFTFSNLDYWNFQEWGGEEQDWSDASSLWDRSDDYSILIDLFRETTDYADDYDSDDEWGDWHNSVSGDYFSTSRLLDFGLGRLHHTDWAYNQVYGHDGDLNDDEVEFLARDLGIWAVEQSAMLLRFFYDDVGEIVNVPTGLDTGSITSSSIELDWNNVPGDADGYVIFRSTGDPNHYSYRHKITSPTSSTYEDSGLSPNTTYYYQVFAYNDIAGLGSGSASLSATTSSGAPVADIGGPYSGEVNSTITLDASDSYDPDGYPLTSYLWDLDNDGQYDDATGVTASFSRSIAREYRIGLKVVDNDEQEDTDETVVTVDNSGAVSIAGAEEFDGNVNTLDSATILIDPTAGSNVDSMRISYDGVTWGDWQAYSDDPFEQRIPAQVLEDAGGQITVYIQYRAGEEISETYSDSLDFTAIPLVVDGLGDAVTSDGVTTLREALLAASLRPGETVGFASGLFATGPAIITLGGSPLRIESDVTVSGPGADTLAIDANGRSRVIDISGSETDFFITGVRLENGVSTEGSGIRAVGINSLTVDGCNISNNLASNNGGGIWQNSGDLTIANTQICNNAAGGGAGGGVFANCHSVITNSMFFQNSAIDLGGGLANYGSVATVTGSRFLGNTADMGGAISCFHGSLRIMNSVLTGNTGRLGGGINNRGDGVSSIVRMTNATVSGNVASSSGGGVYNAEGSNLTYNNSIVALNEGGQIGGTGPVSESNNLTGVEPSFIRNPSDGGDGWIDDPTTSEIDESANNDYGDLRLTESSSAIDAGDNALAVDASGSPLTVDLDGNSRVIGGTVDIGAYEYQSSAGDTTAPAPDPSDWDEEPHATGSTSIRMVATTASDPSGVEYYFECTTAGGHDSEWQDSPTYEDTGLSPGTQYTYKVKARDKSPSQNEGNYSAPCTATTDENHPPERPTCVSPPMSGETWLTPTLIASEFSDPDLGDTHQATRWYVGYTVTAPGEDHTVWGPVELTDPNLISVTVPMGTLEFGTFYTWHVWYQDNHDAWSDMGGGVFQTRTPIDWGTVDFTELNGYANDTEQWYQMQTSQAGYLTVETSFSHANGNIDLELYDAQMQLVDSSTTSTDGERVDVEAGLGETYYLRVLGTNSDVDFRLANLVAKSGTTMTVTGTAEADEFSFTAGTTHRLTAKGVTYGFAAGSVSAFNFAGAGGSDSITLTGTVGNETAALRVGSVTFAGTGLSVSATSVEDIRVYGGGGGSSVRMYDSVGDDLYRAYADRVVMSGDGFFNWAGGFDNTYGYASTGNDDAWLYDSAGDDLYRAYVDRVVMSGDGYYARATGFDNTYGYASTGNDDAWLYDSAGDDLYRAYVDRVVMSGDGYYARATGFVNTYGHASTGNDRARLFDSEGDDVADGARNRAWLYGPGFYNEVADFDEVYAYSTNGGTDETSLSPLAVDFVFEKIGNWTYV